MIKMKKSIKTNSVKSVVTGLVLSSCVFTLGPSNSFSFTDLGSGSEVRTNLMTEVESSSDLLAQAAKQTKSTKSTEKTTKAETKSEPKGKEGKCGEGKCGEGKCGANKEKASKDTKADTSTKTKTVKESKAKEGKCGEGKCGAE